ncbi:MAG: glycosyltransferase family 4 protein, partial [archaeon]|nr:glycosyltransferase family 4 protein [archaeon]
LLSKGLAKRGHEVCVITTNDGSLPSHDFIDGVTILRAKGLYQSFPFLFKDKKRKYHPPLFDPLVANFSREVALKFRPDIVHTQGWISYSALHLRKELRIPVIVHLRDYGFICPKRTLFRTEICKTPLTNECLSCSRNFYGFLKSPAVYYSLKVGLNKLVVNTDRFIATSPFVKEIYSDFFRTENIVVIPNIAVIPDFVQLDRNGLQNQSVDRFQLPRKFILFVGTLTPYKGVNVLLKAFNQLKKENQSFDDVSLIIMGMDHPDYSYRDFRNVTIVRSAARHKILKAYSKCEFVIVPSVWPEPFGLVALEAMGHRKAVVASNIGGLKDIVVNHKTGILVKPNDVRALTDAITYLLRNNEAYLKMGEEGYRRYIDLFNDNVPHIEKLYDEVIETTS